jgi:PAS domain S-box-containing protein
MKGIKTDNNNIIEKESYKLYYMLFENSDEGMMLFSRDGMIFDCNPAATKILGFKKEEILTTDISSIFDSTDPGLSENLEYLKKGIINKELILKCKDGSKIPCEATSKIFTDETGEKIALLNFHDITEHRKKEEELRENEEKYRILFESSGDAIYILERKTRNIKDANPAACELYGYTLDEMMKLNLTDITAEPEKTNEGFEKGITYVPVRHHRKKDGTIFPVEISISPYKLNDEYFHVVYLRDVTDRINIHNQLIHDASFPKLNPNPIFEIDFSLNITMCNPAARKIIKQTGAKDARIFFPEDIEEILKILKQENGKHIQREVTVNDFYYEERISYAPGYDAIRFYCSDITGKKKAEIILRNYQSELENKVNQRTAELIKVNEDLRNEISERYLIEKSLKDSQLETLNEKNRLEVVMDTLPVGIAILNDQGGNIKTNDEFERIWGEKRIIPESIDDYVYYKAWWVESGKPVLKEEWASAIALKKGESVVGQIIHILKFDGMYAFIHNSASPLKDIDGNIIGCVVAVQDITNYMNSEEEMRKSEEKLSALYSSMTEGVALHEIIYDKSGKPVDFLVTDVNPAYEIITGLSRDSAIFKRATELYGTNEPPYFDIYCRVASTGQSETFETYFAPLNKHFNISVFSPGKNKFATVFSDITERIKTEDELRKSEERSRITAQFLENSQQPFGVGFPDGSLGYINSAFEKLTGYNQKELSSIDWGKTLTPPEWNDIENKKLNELNQTGEPVRYEKEYIHKNGARVPIELLVHVKKDEGGKPLHYYSFITDLTLRKKAEKELRKMNRTLKAMEQSSQIMIRATDELTYLNDVCTNIVKECGYTMMWIGYAENDLNKSVKPVAYSGFEEGYLEKLKITWADTERGRGPTGTAIRTGKPVICKNMLTDPEFLPWREEAIKRGYASSLVLPLFYEGKVFGSISIYSNEYDPFSDSEVTLLSDLASDLSHGINTIRLNLAKEQAQEALSESEQRLKFHFENSPLAVVEWNMDYLVTQWSKEAEHIFEWKKEETLGKSIDSLNLIYKEDILIVYRTMERLSGGNENIVVSTNRNYTKSGKVITCTWYNSVLIDEKGEMKSVMSLVEDITERKKMEEELIRAKDELELRIKERTIELIRANDDLTRSENELRTLFEILPVGVSIVDEKRKITNSNPALSKILDFSEEDLIKEKHKKLRYFGGDNTPVSDNEMPSKIAIDNQSVIYNKELGIVKENGDIIWTNINAAPLSESTAVIVISDITEKKISEKKLIESESKLIEAQKLAKIGNWSWNVETGELKWSEELFNITGRDKNKKPPSFEETRSYYTPESLIKRNEAVKRSMELGINTSYDSEMIRVDNNEHIWVQTIIKVEKDESGRVKSLFGTAQDITERKIAEEKLIDNESKLKEAQKLARIGNWSWDVENDIIIWSDELYNIFGRDKELPTPNYSELSQMYTKESWELHNMAVGKTIEEGVPYDIELEFIRNDNKKRGWLNSIGKVEKDSSGKIIKLFGTAQDITERKKAEEELQRASLYARSLIEASLDPLVTISPEGKITDVNNATEKATGYNREELIGTDFSNYFTDKKRAKSGYQKVLKESMVRDYPLTIRHKSGRTIDVSYNAVVYKNDKGELQGVFADARDMTAMKLAELAMKESEKKYRTLFEEAVDGIAMMDSDSFIITDCNKALCHMLDRDKNELVNKPHNMLHPDNSEFMKSLDLKNYSLNDIQLLETKIITKTGLIKDVEIKSSILKLKGKEFILGIFRDVTVRKEIEKQLVDSQNQLRELAHHIQSVREEERKGLSRSLHDNFGQSLTGLKMGVFSLQKKLLKLNELSDDSELFGNIKSMINLIDELIILTGKLSMDLRPNVLDMLGIKAAIEWLVKDYSSKSEIEYKLNSKINNIELNPEHSTEVFRIIQEALTNVLRHAKATQVIVEISEKEDNYVVMVKDNGRGIKENEITSMLSMGILSMRERALLFNGNIELSGKKGKGTTLIIKIPILKK